MIRKTPDEIGSAADAVARFVPHEPHANDASANFQRIRNTVLWEQLYERRRQAEIAAQQRQTQ
jgi:antitoxin (DNA-binding transcriptional repressor) of toxin-antitoxin stability system